MLLKDLYSLDFYREFCSIANAEIKDFSEKKYLELILTEEFHSMELKQRIRHTAICLSHFLPKDYRSAAQIIANLSKVVKNKIGKDQSFEYIFLADYIEEFGVEYFEESMNAIEIVTQCTSCEFAIRPFLLHYFDQTLNRLLQFASHSEANVRRFSSEGSRSRLPWGKGVPQLKLYPEKVLPILEVLKYDSSEYVRRSVANNLNDISKDHKEYYIQIATKWAKESSEVLPILHHSARTLLKQGNKDIGLLFGLQENVLVVSEWKLHSKSVSIGDSLEFSVNVKNNSKKIAVARIEYVVYFLLKNGQFGRKVFMISKNSIESDSSALFVKRHSFKLITTRKYNLGIQKMCIQVNGVESDILEFELTGD